MNFSAASYGVSDYLLLLFVIIATTLVIVALMSLLSTLAKSVKEANSYVGPLMIIILLAAMSNMLFGDKIGSWAYFVPILNSVKAMSEIFSSAAKTWQVLAASLTNFAAAVKAQNYRPDYLLFDACFMANIETLYDLRECTDYVIAAPCEIMAQGFPYERAMPWFFTDGGKEYNLTKVCEAFWNFYMNDATTKSGCISLAVMAEMEGMKEIMRHINAAPQKTYAEELQSYEGMSSHIFYDLGHWVELACSDAGLKEEFKVQLDKAFPKAARLNTPEFYSAYNGRMNPVAYYSGVSFSEPSDKYTEENKQTSWYRDTH